MPIDMLKKVLAMHNQVMTTSGQLTILVNGCVTSLFGTNGHLSDIVVR